MIDDNSQLVTNWKKKLLSQFNGLLFILLFLFLFFFFLEVIAIYTM
jgi:hypothetical protein